MAKQFVSALRTAVPGEPLPPVDPAHYAPNSTPLPAPVVVPVAPVAPPVTPANVPPSTLVAPVTPAEDLTRTLIVPRNRAEAGRRVVVRATRQPVRHSKGVIPAGKEGLVTEDEARALGNLVVRR